MISTLYLYVSREHQSIILYSHIMSVGELSKNELRNAAIDSLFKYASTLDSIPGEYEFWLVDPGKPDNDLIIRYSSDRQSFVDFNFKHLVSFIEKASWYHYCNRDVSSSHHYHTNLTLYAEYELK